MCSALKTSPDSSDNTIGETSAEIGQVPKRATMGFKDTAYDRRFERFEVVDYVVIHAKSGTDPLRSIITDIGLGGLQLRSKSALDQGETCELHIGRGDQDPLIIQAEVRYCREDPTAGMFSSGFRFLPTTHEQRAAIAEFVHSVFLRQADQMADAPGA
ncbi:MAG: PilZ domain-containing protein [Armatimonadetes bacterium]|nr:MAG: PilZ domain-containing protein [Armatimonadota bacterium]